RVGTTSRNVRRLRIAVNGDLRSGVGGAGVIDEQRVGDRTARARNADATVELLERQVEQREPTTGVLQVAGATSVVVGAVGPRARHLQRFRGAGGVRRAGPYSCLFRTAP